MNAHIKFMKSIIDKVIAGETKDPGSLVNPQEFAALSSSLKDFQIYSLLEDLKEGKLVVAKSLLGEKWYLQRGGKV